jgi:hypothetical protein
MNIRVRRVSNVKMHVHMTCVPVHHMNAGRQVDSRGRRKNTHVKRIIIASEELDLGSPVANCASNDTKDDRCGCGIDSINGQLTFRYTEKETERKTKTKTK